MQHDTNWSKLGLQLCFQCESYQGVRAKNILIIIASKSGALKTLVRPTEYTTVNSLHVWICHENKY